MALSEISIDEFENARVGHTVVDVREVDEYVAGHVPGAMNVPLGTVPDNVAAFTGAKVYLICQVGGRSQRACEFLDGVVNGVEFVNVLGGTGAWIASGREVVTGDSPS